MIHPPAGEAEGTSIMSESTSELGYEQSDTADLTESDRHRLLADGRRRLLLEELETQPMPVGLNEAAAAVAQREANGADPAELRQGIAIALHHNHLPRMTDLGVIDYDPETRQIRTV